MAKAPLTKDSEFIVGEEKILHYVLALLFLALFMYGFIDAIKGSFKQFNHASFLAAIVPAIFFFIKAKSKRIFIRVNKKGIYKDEKLLTSWPGFINAYISQKDVAITIRDNFILVVEYRKEGINTGFRRTIPLTNTQNKAEEEVLEAVMFFWKEYKKERNVF